MELILFDDWTGKSHFEWGGKIYIKIGTYSETINKQNLVH
jgi:hypothetical protein